jgi:hypothetical protein
VFTTHGPPGYINKQTTMFVYDVYSTQLQNNFLHNVYCLLLFF